MTTYPLAWQTFVPVVRDEFQLFRAQTVHEAIGTGQQQVVARFSQWRGRIELRPAKLIDAEKALAWIDSLNGQIGTFNYSPTQSSVSTLSGITVQTTVSPYATTARLAGWGAGAPSLLRAGQMLQIGSQLIRILTAPANADGSGRCDIEFAPPARSTWTAGFAVECDLPLALFRLSGNAPSFSQGPDGWVYLGTLEVEEAL